MVVLFKGLHVSVSRVFHDECINPGFTDMNSIVFITKVAQTRSIILSARVWEENHSNTIREVGKSNDYHS